MMSTSRSLDVLEGDRSREWRSYRQLGNPECREETSGSGPIDYHNQFVEICNLRSSSQAARQREIRRIALIVPDGECKRFVNASCIVSGRQKPRQCPNRQIIAMPAPVNGFSKHSLFLACPRDREAKETVRCDAGLSSSVHSPWGDVPTSFQTCAPS